MLLWASAHCSTVSQREGGRGGEEWDTKAAVDMKRGTHAKWTTKYYAWHEQRTYSSCCEGGGDFDMHVRVYADFWVLSSKALQRHLKLETVSLWAQAAWHEQKHELKWKETCSLAAQWTQSRLIWKHNRLLSFYTLLRKTNYAHPTCYCLFKSSCQFFLSFFFMKTTVPPITMSWVLFHIWILSAYSFMLFIFSLAELSTSIWLRVKFPHPANSVPELFL